MDWLLNLLTGKPRRISKDAARSSYRKALFSNRKIKDALGMEFIPMDRSIKETAGIYLEKYASDG
jgi:hypothetical protein